MRIRKNAGKFLCPLSIPAQSLAVAEEREAEGEVMTSVCVLNQSPWDAMSFTPPRRSVAPRFHEEAEVEDKTAAVRGATQTSPTEEIEEEAKATAVRDLPSFFPAELTFRRRVKIEVVEAEIEKTDRSNKKRRGKKWAKKKKTVAERNGVVGKTEKEASASPTVTCKKTDGKGWFCKREAHYPHSLCEYHLIQVRSYYSGGTAGCQPRACRRSGEHTNDSKRPERKKTSRNGGGDRTSDFYYYSGFGPWWAKRRNKAKGDVEEVRCYDRSADAGVHDDGKMDGGEALVDGDGVDDSGKRRGRKPIKARSLKSLL